MFKINVFAPSAQHRPEINWRRIKLPTIPLPGDVIHMMEGPVKVKSRELCPDEGSIDVRCTFVIKKK